MVIIYEYKRIHHLIMLFSLDYFVYLQQEYLSENSN